MLNVVVLFFLCYDFRKLVEYVNQTDFHGVSGHIKFDGSDRPGSIHVLQHFFNGTHLVGQYTPGAHGGHLIIEESKIMWLTSHGSRPDDGHAGKFNTNTPTLDFFVLQKEAAQVQYI